ncbi:whirlin-like isoform X2 [Anneissia japonica]|uniref:whirlin-like isoform X2 n=1 Tax=Anneissia japonica TaxID=1529436 RepID=UPI00142599F9|nr:whirlin-like isoform X2 [Anneissia japonica]
MSIQQPVPRPRSKHGHRHSQQAANSRTLSTNVRRLQEELTAVLNEDDHAFFVHALNDYNAKRNVYSLVQNLRTILNTPEKQRLYLLLGKVVPNSDQALFWQHAELPQPVKNDRTINNNSNNTRNYNTMPTRTQQVIQNWNPAIEPHGKTIRKAASQSGLPQQDVHTNIHRIILKKSKHENEGLGFSIRGGAEHGVGIFISKVDVGSVAEERGIQTGDQLLSVNDTSFEKIRHEEAVKILKTAKKLNMVISSVGRVPGSYVSHQTYTWVNPQGRSVSPPPNVAVLKGKMTESQGRKSSLNLLNDGDERKVNLVIGDGQSLGLMIRGGLEFGLGIYITGIDAYSVSDAAGLKVGDQILDVNGRSFLEIEHQEAVNILKSSKLMMMTIKDVGKLPYARTTVDKTQWIMGDQLSMLDGDDNTQDPVPDFQNGNFVGRGMEMPSFKKGIAGSQIMYNTSMTWNMIEEQARQLLNENERGTMKYYLGEYQKAHISVDELVLALFELLNTHAKFSLLSEIRSFMVPKDIDRYDTLVLKREVEAMKARQRIFPQKEKENSIGETFSGSSHYSSGSIDSRPITPPQIPSSIPFPKKGQYNGGMHSHMNGYENSQMNGFGGLVNGYSKPHTNGFDSKGGNSKLPDFLPDFLSESPPPPLINSSSSHLSPTSPGNQQTIQADVHRHASFAKYVEPIYSEVKSPSEDSGVDVLMNSGRMTVHRHEPLYAGMSDAESPPPVFDHSAPQPTKSRHSGELERRHSFDSVTTDSSNNSVLLDLPRRSSGPTSENGVPRRISDPTHHVPRDQKRSINQTKKASQQLYDLKKSDTSPTYPSSNNYSSIYEQIQRSSHEKQGTSTPSPMSSKNGTLTLSPIPAPQSSMGTPIYATVNKSRQRSGKTSATSSSEVETNSRNSSLRSRSPSAGSGRSSLGSLKRNPAVASKMDEPPLQVEILINISDRDAIKKYGEEVQIRKVKPTLGIAVEGGAGTRQPLPKVIKVQGDGAASHSSNLRVGHVILKVNNKSLLGLDHKAATRLIAEAFKNKSRSSIDLLVLDSNAYRIIY